MAADQPLNNATVLGFAARPLTSQSWLGRMLRLPDKGGAMLEIEALLATTPWDQVSMASVQAILARRHLQSAQARGGLTALFRTAVAAAMADGGLSDYEDHRLCLLESMLELPAHTARDVRRECADEQYRDALTAAVTDHWLSEDEKRLLEDRAAKLRIPEERVVAIRQEVLGALMQDEFRRAIQDRRLSPDEEQHLRALAENLGVKLSYEPEADALVERCRLLWRLEQGQLPTVAVPVHLPQGEVCHAQIAAELSELRTVTTGVGYSGPTGRIRIAKGLYWRVGQLSVNRMSQEVLKPIDAGTLYITNKRLLFDGAKKTTSITLRRIINFTIYSDGVKIEKDSGKDQFFQTQGGDLEVLGALLDGALVKR